MLLRIDRILLRVPALAGAVHYYRDVLGMKLLRQDNQTASLLMGDGATELVLRADPEQPAEEIYYLVDDVRDLYNRRQQLQLKFVQPPRQATRGYRAAVKDPFGNVLLLLDRTTESAGGNATEDAAVPTMLFSGVEASVPAKRELLVRLYQEVGRTADDLPYTPQFEKLYDLYSAQHAPPKPTRREVWRHLLNLRKGGKLPKLGEARSPSPEVAADAEQNIRDLLGKDIGKRDRLPYTERFEKLVDDFNKTQPRPLSPHLVWRLVAKLAK
ncbi:MAG: VOC family protein [Tepidisphaeraceae bacterium]|jgi:catechol 2,3-dioxygenase-like lactoylglutathione lyase family enzyme